MTLPDKLKQELAKLSQEEKREVIKYLEEETSKNEEPKKTRSLLELAGLGKEVWKGIDPDEYIRNLRDEWD